MLVAKWLGLIITVRVRARAREWKSFLFYSFLSVNVMDIICCVLLVVVRHQYDVIGHEAW